MLNRLRKNKDKLKKEVIEMEQVELEIAQENDMKPGNFLGLVLLDSNAFDFNKFKNDFKEDWNLEANFSKSEVSDEAIVFEVEGAFVTLALMPVPVSGEEIIENAQANFYWQDAVEVTKRHKAHLIVAVLNKDNTIVNAAELFVKVSASCLKQENATAFNTLNIVFRGGFYRDNALTTIKVDKRFPLLNLVFLELYTTDGNSVSAYTYGLEHLGKKEIEIIESKNSMEDVHLLLYNTVFYLLGSDVNLKTGETIGFDENQKLDIVESLGFALDPNKTTFKIDY